jgi:hypothetical protein
MTAVYEDNFGFWEIDGPEERAFFEHVQRQSARTTCKRCKQPVRLIPPKRGEPVSAVGLARSATFLDASRLKSLAANFRFQGCCLLRVRRAGKDAAVLIESCGVAHRMPERGRLSPPCSGRVCRAAWET